MPINVAIIEDHEEFRKSIAYVLRSTPGFSCAGEYGSLEDALEQLNSSDLILLDIHLPGMSGIEGIPLLKERFPGVPILMLTVFDDNTNIFHAILAGADGYLLKKTSPPRLLQAIEDAVQGGTPMTPLVARQAIKMFKEYVPPVSHDGTLTDREMEILKLVIEGLSNEEIADKLFISIETVRNHIRHIYSKLHVHSKTQAVVKAIRHGYI